MSDLSPRAKAHPPSQAAAPLRRGLSLAGAGLAIGIAVLLVLGVDCAVYLAFSGEPPSLAVLWQQASRWLCGLLRTCSA